MYSEYDHAKNNKLMIICPECSKKEIKSKVFLGIKTERYPNNDRKQANLDPYYDKQGHYHCHSEMIITQNYTCSNGHSFSHNQPTICPSPQCIWSSSKENK